MKGAEISNRFVRKKDGKVFKWARFAPQYTEVHNCTALEEDNHSRNWATNGHMGAVEPFVFRKPCTNDLIVSQEKSFRHAHIHLTEYEMTRRMAEVVSEGFRLASYALDSFVKTRIVSAFRLSDWLMS